MRYHLNPAKLSHQRGVVLIIALIILLALTIIGVSGMSTTTMQERMAANSRDQQLAFQIAEAALRDGERYIQNTTIDPTKFDTNCTNGLCDCSDHSTGCVEYWTDPTLDVWNTPSRHMTYSVTDTQVAAQPKYIIEYMGQVVPDGTISSAQITASDPMMFRITAVGYGQSPNAKVMLQSTYKK